MIKKTLLTTLLILGCLLGAGELRAAVEIDGIYYSFDGSGSSRKATVTYETSSYNSYSGDVIIPSTVYYNNYNYPVTNIGMHAFELCTELTSVTIPSSVKAIEMYAFKDCTGLTSIDIPSSVTSIGGNAFLNCTALTSINGQSSVTSISMNAFKGCTNLESITVLGNITSIPSSTFEGCSNLASMPIPNSVTTIAGTAFKDCTSLTSITIPSSVTTINANAFQGCTSLTEINYNVTTLSDFSSSSLPFKGCTSSNITVNIGFNVEYIPAYTFSGIDVTEITIPNSVTGIGNNAFGNYTKLSTVYMLGTTPPTLANNSVFKTSYYNYATIKVLSSSDESILNAYKGATYWSDFSSNISETDNVTIANMDLTNGSLTIPAGNTITVTGTLTNTDASHLTIADGGQLICNNEVSITAKKSIEGWTVLNNNSGYLTDGWYFIASPLSKPYTPAAPMTSNTYDLFRLNPSTSKWENIKNSSHTDFTTLTNGRGYLYANSNTIDLEFTGTIKASEETYNMTVYNGLNLIGNPFTYNVYANCSYYRMNSAKNAIEGVEEYWTNPIAPCTGIIVEANGESTVTFSKDEPAHSSAAKGNIQMVLSQTVNHRGTSTTETLDNAIVSFNQGSELSKFYFGTQNANIYIPQNGKEFAIVSAGQEGQIPLNFRARVNGQYTLSFTSPLTSSLSSLTLVDNLTGAHVDLLQTPSYTFQGNTTDISARFRLLFTTTGVDENADEGQTDFAFISDGQLIVNGTGILYVYDALGRQVSAKQVTPLTSTLSPLTSGLYVLQLVEGNSVRTQKIIVK